MKRKITGIVLTTNMQETAIIGVENMIVNKKYGKQIRRTRKYFIDNPENKAQVGNLVEAEECAPISKMKRWKLVQIIK